MDKYEYKLRTEQMLEFVNEGEYAKAAEIADTIDWHRVRNATMLATVGDIYEKTGNYAKSYEILKMVYDRSDGSRKVVYRLGLLALGLGNIDEAIDYLDEFEQLAPKDPNRYILRYRILRARRAPIEQQIEALESFKKSEYIEKWAYELAKLYQEAGMTAECLEECDDLILWFSEGEYVYKAMELKMQYKPLTPSQMEKYNQYREGGKEASVQEEVAREEVSGEDSEKIQEETPEKLQEGLEGETEEPPAAPSSQENAPSIGRNMALSEAIAAIVNGTIGQEEAQAAPKTQAPGEPQAAPEAQSPMQPQAPAEAQEVPEDQQIEGQLSLSDLLGASEEEKAPAGEAKAPAEEREDAAAEADTDALVEALELSEAEAYEEDDLSDFEEEDLAEEDGLSDFEEEDLTEEDDLSDFEEEDLTEEDDLSDFEEEDLTEDEPEAAEDDLPDVEEPEDLEDDLLEEDDDLSDFEEEEWDEDLEDFEEEAETSRNTAGEGVDDREVPDDDDFPDLLAHTAPLSRKETAKMIATGKTAPLPLDEISNALSMGDTGFIVHGRYDLETQSGVGTRAGLTEEQKKIFSYFVPVRGMSEQLVDVLEQDRNCTNRHGTSRTGNLLIIGRKGSGKTVLAVDVVKAIQKQRKIRQGKVAIIAGDALNKKKLTDIFDKLYGGALIIEKAGKMNERTVTKLNRMMEEDTGEMMIVLEEQRKPLDRLLSSNREFRRKFTSRLEVPIFINDELVTFGQTYARENGYRIDEMGILALYSRIDALQREDHPVNVAEVKEIMDEAIYHSQKSSAKRLVKKVLRKSTDEADRVILSEKDFEI